MTEILMREHNPPPRGCFVAIDPAKWGAAWAVVGAAGQLLVCGLWSWTTKGALVEAPPWASFEPSTLVAEFPQCYTKSVADPDDILALAYTVGRLVQQGGVACALYHPKTWKGNTPKAVHHARMRETLPPAWLVVLDRDTQHIPARLRHNVWDAVGLAAWVVTQRGSP